MSDDPRLIVRVLQGFFSGWEPPRDNGKEWVQCLCPFHGDSRPSAAVSYKNDAFKCFACPAKGDAIKLIQRQEGLSYREAVEYAEGISARGREDIPERTPRKSRRVAFGESRVRSGGSSKSVRSRIRG